MKAYDVCYSREALADLDNVWDDVLEASSDIDTADRYVNRIADSIREESKVPKTGIPLEFEGQFTGIFYLVYKKYIAFYRIRDSRIEVSRILYGASDYMKTLFGKNEYDMEDNEE